jgi:hypothetical protein
MPLDTLIAPTGADNGISTQACQMKKYAFLGFDPGRAVRDTPIQTGCDG